MTLEYHKKNVYTAHVSTPSEPAAGLMLPRHGTVSLRPSGESVELRVWSGRLWVTQEADGGDHILAPGETFRTHGPGLVVIEALEESTFAMPHA
ncbi:DUF2917 domain-containing protein [bacterium]|nr:MAG: DUF2917 domain-containing protein [bacterium]